MDRYDEFGGAVVELNVHIRIAIGGLVAKDRAGAGFGGEIGAPLPLRLRKGQGGSVLGYCFDSPAAAGAAATAWAAPL